VATGNGVPAADGGDVRRGRDGEPTGTGRHPSRPRDLGWSHLESARLDGAPERPDHDSVSLAAGMHPDRAGGW